MILHLLPMFLLISFASVNAVLFTPALPAITQYFSLSPQIGQQLMTFFLIGYTLGQLIYGPLSNRYGRKPAITIGIVIQILSQFICLLSVPFHLFNLLLLGRFFAALGAGVGLKMTITMVNEAYDSVKARKITAYLIMAFAVTPGPSIAIGGYLNANFGWLSCFYAGAIYGFILWVLTRQLPETCQHIDKDALALKPLWQNTSRQFLNGQLVKTGLLMGSATSFIYLFATLTPFIAMTIMGIDSKTYGLLNLIPTIGLVIGSFLAAKYTHQLSTKHSVLIGIIITGFTIVWMAAAMVYNATILWMIFIPMILGNLGLSFVFSNAPGLIMHTLTDKANGSAVMNFINMGLATLIVLSAGCFQISALLLIGLYAALSLFMMGLLIRL